MLGALLVASAAVRPVFAGDLDGSRDSMKRQHSVAVDLDYRFALTPSQVEQVVADGALERVGPNADFELSGVSYPYARPEVRLFIERLAADFHAMTGTPLVVTSLTRPVSLQPANASPLSVHPAGMAVDLRIPSSRKALRWLQSMLLSMEEADVIDVTRELNPPHLHVAVFPNAYAQYAERQDSVRAARRFRTVILASSSGTLEPTASETGQASASALFIAAVMAALLSLVAGVKRWSAAAVVRLRIGQRPSSSEEASGTP
jgi:hypothetical protein